MTPAARPVIGVLLAAGAGRRLGRGPKALLTLGADPQHEPQVVRMTQALLRGGCEPVVVVVGAGGDRVRRALDQAEGLGGSRSVVIVANERWETGMGSSFRAGVETADRLLAGCPGGSIMVALVDQPDVGKAVVWHLRQAATGQGVSAAGYPDAQGRLIRGHPILFPRHMAREAAADAAGDAAGRAWLRAHPELVEVLDVGHLATGRDVDTPGDLRWWSESVGAQHRAGGHGSGREGADG